MHLLTALSGKLYFPTCLTDHSSVVFDQSTSGNSLVLRVNENAHYPQIQSVNISYVDCSKLSCWTYMCIHCIPTGTTRSSVNLTPLPFLLLIYTWTSLLDTKSKVSLCEPLPCWSDVHFTYVHCNESLTYVFCKAYTPC